MFEQFDKFGSLMMTIIETLSTFRKIWADIEPKNSYNYNLFAAQLSHPRPAQNAIQMLCEGRANEKWKEPNRGVPPLLSEKGDPLLLSSGSLQSGSLAH